MGSTAGGVIGAFRPAGGAHPRRQRARIQEYADFFIPDLLATRRPRRFRRLEALPRYNQGERRLE